MTVPAGREAAGVEGQQGSDERHASQQSQLWLQTARAEIGRRAIAQTARTMSPTPSRRSAGH